MTTATKEATHTPGPWTLDEIESASPGAIYQLNAKSRFPLVELEITDAESEANARLIAAAPEMLEALEALLDITPFAKDSMDSAIHERARAAIRKARGEVAA